MKQTNKQFARTVKNALDGSGFMSVPMQARTKRHRHYVTVARREYATDDIEIDDNPNISPLEDKSGCWVAAWVWVSSDLEQAHDD